MYIFLVFKKSSSLKNHLRSHRDYESAESSNEDDDTEDGDWESPASETAK